LSLPGEREAAKKGSRKERSKVSLRDCKPPFKREVGRYLEKIQKDLHQRHCFNSNSEVHRNKEGVTSGPSTRGTALIHRGIRRKGQEGRPLVTKDLEKNRELQVSGGQELVTDRVSRAFEKKKKKLPPVWYKGAVEKKGLQKRMRIK